MSTEAVTSTPTAAPAAAPPAAAPTGTPGAPAKPAVEKTLTRRTYDVSGGPRAGRHAEVQAAANTARAGIGAPAPAAAAPPAPPVAKPAAVAEPVTAPAPAAETPPAADAAPAADVAPTEETPAEETVAAETEEPKIDAKEFAARFARLARQERRIVERERQVAELEARHKVAIGRVAEVEKFGEHLRRDPLGSLKRVFNIEPQVILDAILADGVKPGAASQPQRPNETQSQYDQRIAALEQQLKDAAQQTQRQQQESQVRDYIAGEVAPILADKSAFAFVNHEFGATAPKVIYDTMYERFKKTGKTPSPLEVARFIENTLRTKAENSAKLLGVGAGAKQPASQAKVATPPAKPPVAAQPQPVVAARTRSKTVSSPYSSKLRG